jgi:hypothetical protein
MSVSGEFRPPPVVWSGIGMDGWDGTTAPNDRRLISASSVPKALASPALERWAINTTIERLIEEMPTFQALASDPAAAVTWASQLRFKPKDGAELSATESGTAFHHLLECWLEGKKPDAETVASIERDPVLTAMATHLWGWFNTAKPVAVEIERVVYDPENGIAGRLDSIVAFPHTMPELGQCLVDLKTSREARYKSGGLKKVYGDANALQLAAYRYSPLMATFEPRIEITKRKTSNRIYLLNDAEMAACVPTPHIDSTYILSLNAEGVKLLPLDTGPAVHERVIQAVGLHRWINGEAAAVVGAPIAPAIALPDLS